MEIHDEILRVLKDRAKLDPLRITPGDMAIRLKHNWDTETVKTALEAMKQSGDMQSAVDGNKLKYFLPLPKQVMPEPRKIGVYKMPRQMTDLREELRVARDAIPSIG